MSICDFGRVGRRGSSGWREELLAWALSTRGAAGAWRPSRIRFLKLEIFTLRRILAWTNLDLAEVLSVCILAIFPLAPCRCILRQCNRYHRIPLARPQGNRISLARPRRSRVPLSLNCGLCCTRNTCCSARCTDEFGWRSLNRCRLFFYCLEVLFSIHFLQLYLKLLFWMGRCPILGRPDWFE